MATPRKLYLSHPVSLYGTPAKIALVKGLEAAGWIVVDPEAPEYAEVYNLTDVVRRCDALGFLPFQDGSVGASVAREILEAFVNGMPVYNLVDALCMGGEYLHDLNRVVSMPKVILTIEDTRLKVKAIRDRQDARFGKNIDAEVERVLAMPSADFVAEMHENGEPVEDYLALAVSVMDDLKDRFGAPR